MSRLPELLMPVGGPESLPVALAYGADAVYLGLGSLSLRAKADNFDLPSLKEALSVTHGQNKRLYLTVNILAHPEDLKEAADLFKTLNALEDRPDAFIISDPGLFRLSRRHCPSVPVHLSTQASTCNEEAFLFWYEQGIRRIVCARELSLADISRIRERIPADMEIEAFVHGSMCMSYSGRCLISDFLTGREANRGACTQPCRWSYALVEEKRPGEYMPMEEDERGTYLYNSRDLCMIAHLPEMIRAGISCLKVEGRMKNELYLATIGRAYRLALDALKESEEAYRRLLPFLEEEVLKCTTRDHCTGFYFGKPGEEARNLNSSAYRQDYRFLGRVQQDEKGFFIIQKNKFSAGTPLELIRPDGSNIVFSVESFVTEIGEKMDSCPHPGQKLYLHTQADLHNQDIIREKTHE